MCKACTEKDKQLKILEEKNLELLKENNSLIDENYNQRKIIVHMTQKEYDRSMKEKESRIIPLRVCK